MANAYSKGRPRSAVRTEHVELLAIRVLLIHWPDTILLRDAKKLPSAVLRKVQRELRRRSRLLVREANGLQKQLKRQAA